MNPTIDYIIETTKLAMVPPPGFLERFGKIINDVGVLKTLNDVISFNRLCEYYSYQSTIYILSSVIKKERRKEILARFVDSGTASHLVAWLNSILVIEKERDKFHYDELIEVIINALFNLPLHKPAVIDSKIIAIIKEVRKCGNIVRKSERSMFSKLKRNIKDNIIQNNSDLYERMVKDPVLRQKFSRYEYKLKIDYENIKKQKLEQVKKTNIITPIKYDERKFYNIDCGIKYDFNLSKIYPTLNSENKHALVTAKIDVPPIVCDYPDNEYELEDTFVDFLPTSPTNIEVVFEASRIFNMNKGHPEPHIDSFVGTLVKINGTMEKQNQFAKLIKDDIKNDSNSIKKEATPLLYTEDIDAICPERRARIIPSKTVKYCGVGGNKDVVAAVGAIENYNPLKYKDFITKSILKDGSSIQNSARVKFLAGPLLVVTYHSSIPVGQDSYNEGSKAILLTRPVLGIKNVSRIGSFEDPPRIKHEGIEYPRFPTFFVPCQVPRAIQVLESKDVIQYMQYGTIKGSFRTKTFNFIK